METEEEGAKKEEIEKQIAEGLAKTASEAKDVESEKKRQQELLKQ